MHLTNYSINKMSEDYVRPSKDEILLDNDSTKRTLASLYSTLESKGVDVAAIKANIAKTCARTMEMYGPMIEHQMEKLTGLKGVKGKPF